MRLRTAVVGTVALLACLLPGMDAVRSADKATTAVKGEFSGKLLPFLDTHCLSCHNDKKAQGSLDLSIYKDEASLVKDRAVWEGLVERVRNKEMPPAKRPQPSDADRTAILAYLDKTLTEATCTGPVNPGRVTLRRLNRAEYNNTIRDLVGVDFHPADDFPDDPVGYGFDNIGDVLSLSPLLMEKYLSAAEQIVERAFQPDTSGPQATARRITGGMFRGGTRGKVKDQQMILTTKDDVVATVQFPFDGEYLLRTRANGSTVGKDAPKFVLKLDGKEVQSFETAAGKKNGPSQDVKVTVKAGQHTLAAHLANPYTDPKEKDPTKAVRTITFVFVDMEGPINLPPAPPSASQKRIMVAQPGPSLTRAEAARKILTTFARRAYRRPATTDEVSRLMKLVDLAAANGDSFEAGIKLALQAVLTSPHFLFRVELDRGFSGGQNSYKISDLELASRLSYFLWSSLPDEELQKAAELNKLREPGVLATQVKRMLKDPKAAALGENFAAQWLQIRNLKITTPDAKLFPKFDDKLREAMFSETSLFFGAVVKEDRGIFDFLDADFTYLNERLAEHYGIKGVKGEEFRRVSLKGTKRAGILTHASVLTVTSNPTRTSPVKRGKFIVENLLNATIPPPPPDAGELEDGKHELKGTLRQKMEQHRANPSCASCHQRMDPIGFAFEHYDAIGAWREKDGTFAIETAGTLADGTPFNDAGDLPRLLKAKDDQFRRCLVEKLLTYATGRGLEHADKCSVDQLAGKVKADRDRFSAVVMAIVQSEPFQMRSRTRGTSP